SFPDGYFCACLTDPPYELDFMGAGWDRSGIAFDVSLWKEVGRVLKPGAHLMAFGGPRTYHRLASAIEDSGFEIRDSLLWIYGSGMPKGKRLPGGKATGLRPSWEPIVLARKRFRGSVASCLDGYGTGALCVEACRFGAPESKTRAPKSRGTSKPTFTTASASQLGGDDSKGRWPCNVLLSPEAAEEVGRQSGWSRSPASVPQPSYGSPTGLVYGLRAGIGRSGQLAACPGDSGTAARYFPQFSYCKKANRRERGEGNDHPTVKPQKLLEWLLALIEADGIVLDPFLGSGSTALAAKSLSVPLIGIEQDPHYCNIALRRLK
ncbi:MAG TPA: site-specific DNA-methyltransferase, partial [Candidatus Paceibacterota bacterium]